jgi:hypothetical protein
MRETAPVGSQGIRSYRRFAGPGKSYQINKSLKADLDLGTGLEVRNTLILTNDVHTTGGWSNLIGRSYLKSGLALMIGTSDARQDVSGC